jgi:hypothetical protein
MMTFRGALGYQDLIEMPIPTLFGWHCEARRIAKEQEKEQLRSAQKLRGR